MLCFAIISKMLPYGRERQLHFTTRGAAIKAANELTLAGFTVSDVFETIASPDLMFDKR